MPARTEPVIATSCGVGCSTSARPVSRSPVTTLKHARRAGTRRRSRPAAGSSPASCRDGLSTTVLPAAIAGRELPDRHHHRVVPGRHLADDADRLAPDQRGVPGHVLPGAPGPRAPGRRRRRTGAGRPSAGSPRSRSGRAACRCSRPRARRTRRRAPRWRRRASAAPAAARSGWCRATSSKAVGGRGVGARRRRLRRRSAAVRDDLRRWTGSTRSVVGRRSGLDVLAVDEVAQDAGARSRAVLCSDVGPPMLTPVPATVVRVATADSIGSQPPKMLNSSPIGAMSRRNPLPTARPGRGSPWPA